MDSILLDFLTQLGGWNWLIIAAILFILEFILPGFHLLFFGLAALITGLLGMTLGLPWQVQMAIFATLSVALAFLSRLLWNPHIASDEPTLNTGSQKYIGNQYKLITPIVNGRGKVKVGDTNWIVSGPDLPTGTTVKVTNVQDSVLIVEQV